MAERESPPAQQSLQLILARSLIETLSTPAFLVDPRQVVVFYNDAAGDFLGMRYEETGKIPLSKWREITLPSDEEGRPLSDADLPVTLALDEERPVHTAGRIRTADGSGRDVEIMALPLIGPNRRHEGAVGVVWQREPPP